MVDFPHKVLVPRRADYLVSRPRLNELLAEIADRRLITLSAPAGYGKTSLLVDFAATCPLPVCWYTLDPSDQDPWVFLDYLVAAIEQRFPGATRQTTAMLSAGSRTAFATVLALLAREVYAIGRDFVVVLDDWHLVDQSPEVSEVVTQLLLHCPHCHLILASRTYPSLPNIMLLTARRQMSSLNEHHLRFTTSEVDALLQVEEPGAVSSEQVTALTEQTNGWITGILLSLQTTDVTTLDLAPSSIYAERQVYRYLVEQVFDQQPPEVRQFLLDSSLLEELTPQACDAIFQRKDARRLLDMLLRRRLFLAETRQGVLRYHPLFREFLQEHYSTVDPLRYHDHALHVAAYYAAQGHWLLAFGHYVAAGDLAAAQRVIAEGGESLYNNGRWETLEHWFSVVPEDDLDAPLLCLKARVLLDRGRANEAQLLAQMAETRVQPADRPLVMLLHAQIARVTGRYEDALAMAEQVLLITSDVGHRARALRTIAICHHRLGQTRRAIAELNEALEIERERGDLSAVANLQRDLGICHREIGLLRAAEDFYMQADNYWAAIGNIGLRAMSLNSKGGVQQLDGRYVDAHATLLMALQCAREATLPHYQAAVLSNLGDLYCDLRLWDRARDSYDDARKVGASAHLNSCLDVSAVGLYLRQHQYDAAARELRQLPEATRRRHAIPVLILGARIASGLGQHEQAAHSIQQAIIQLEEQGPSIELAVAYLAQAQIAAGNAPTDHEALLAPLERAQAIATQLGHDAFLVAETLPMRALVTRAASFGSAHAADWLQRHQDLRLAAQLLTQDEQRPVLVVRTLGMDKIILNGQPVDIGWHKAREVFYYLFAHPEGCSIDTLREAIWPDLGAERSSDALRSAIYQLRSSLMRELITLHGRQVYRINRDIVHIDYDVERFLQALDASANDEEALIEAFSLYNGPYLVSTDNQWCAALRTHLEWRYLQTHHIVAGRYVAKNRYAEALPLYQQILAVDALDEAASAGLMRCYMALGNRAAAINQYQELRKLLDNELGLDPELASEVEQLYRQLLAA